jgi:hypothetical protein
MRFRLHAMAAIMGILLLPLPGRAQDQPAQPSAGQQNGQQNSEPNPPAEQEKLAPLPQSTTSVPIEPVMSGPYPVMSKAAEDRARQIFEMFNHGEFSQMWATLSEGRKKATPIKEEKFVDGNKKLRERMGTETSMIEENIVPYPFAPDTIYSRLTNFSNLRQPITFIITINQRGQIDDFDFKLLPDEIAEGRYAGYTDTVKLKLPFNGSWLVFQGGRKVFENPNASSDDQRYSVDFAYLKDGYLFVGPGGLHSKNTDYFCFGQPILAPADGEVIKAEAGYDDNPPGRPSGDPADGNVVIISHGNGESSLVNHLKQNSLRVKRGDKVKQGDVIAECGNSGAGPVPHLHYQLQRTTGVPLPAQFNDYIADGKPVASGEPVRGQLVSNSNGAQAANITSSSGKMSVMTSTPASNSANTTAQKPSH